MNKKIKYLSSILALVVTTASSSCIYSRNFNFLEWIKSNTSSSTTVKKTDGDITYNTPEYPSSFTKANLNKDNIGLGLNQRYLPSTGNSKLLVIPIEFKDGGSFSNTQLSIINNTFFGESSDTGWESAKSFYSKSSYSKMNLSGIVTSPVTANYTLAQIDSLYKKNNDYTYTSISDSILVDAVSKVSSEVNLSEYDTNNDGYLDGVWLVYNYPYQSSGNSLFWAYTYWSNNNQAVNNKRMNVYAWASFDFLYDNSYYASKIDKTKTGDAHTIIHETGHMLGLDDYYTNTKLTNGSYESPTAAVDMMDNNIIDHMAYSKYALNWINPTVINEDYLSSRNNQITINSLVETGESYILPIYKNNTVDYNNTAFDEYLLLETYTPTSLNYQDATKKYQNGVIAPSDVGLRVYHVDARVGKISVDTKSYSLVWDSCAYDMLPINNNDNYAYYYLYSNNSSYSYGTISNDENYNFYRTRLVSLLPKNERKPSTSNVLSNNSLYVTGDKFLISGGSYTNFKFDDGSKPQFGFEVKSVDKSSVTLSFSKI